MKSVSMHNKIKTVLLLSFTFFLSLHFSVLTAQEIDETRQSAGKKLFKSLCSSCHKLNGNLIGPALAGVETRRDNDWLKSWIRNNAEFQKVNAEAREAAKYHPSAMTAFPQLTDEEIDNILYYTTVGDVKKEVAADNTTVGGGGGAQGAPEWLIYILAAAIVVAFLMIASLLKQVNELKGNTKPEQQSNLRRDLNELWEGVKQNTFLKVMGTILLLLITAYVGFGTLFKVGVDQGYMPLQPIAFSHKIHAGENKIDCQYCHSSAKHSKHSGIPSVNVCMNCHMNIAEVAENTQIEWDGQTYGKAELDKEIAKIYVAAGWNPETLEYTGKTKPVKWIRIHNLPDFAYFNHSQHVKVGGIECQKCHGPVEEMDEMYQFSPLTMGWCINCHKESNVDLQGNEYYKKVHDELAKKYNVEQVTIAQLGGKECGKCHY